MSGLDVGAVLHPHLATWRDRYLHCICGWASGVPLSESLVDNEDGYRTHLADVLTARIGEVLGGLREEAHAAVASVPVTSSALTATDAVLAVVVGALGGGEGDE